MLLFLKLLGFLSLNKEENEVGARGFPPEDEEEETLIKDKSLCLLSCVPQQLLQPPPPPVLLQRQAHSLTLCSVPAAWESAARLPLRTHTRAREGAPVSSVDLFFA